MPNWETIDVPVGTYIGWGNKKGQHVTGTVLDYDPTGGTDFNGDPCPLLEIQLSEKAASFDKELNRTNYDKGETVFLTCGLKALKRAIKKTDPDRGDLIRIELEGTEKVDKGTVKLFGIQIARGAGKVEPVDESSKAKAKPASKPADDDDDDDDDDDEPPF